MKIKNCPICGNPPTWKPNNYMCDMLECIPCGVRTPNYFDGAEFAIDDWNNRINRDRNDKKRKN